MIRVGVLGATGYAGIETVRLLCGHPEVEITRVVSKSFVGKKISEVYPSLTNVLDLVCCDLDPEDIAAACDVVFTALPHGASKTVIPDLYERGLTVIDLSGDFRYNSVEVYEKWYGEPHSAPELLKQSVYGLCELHRDQIKGTRLIGNPGCYTTCSILPLYPLLKKGIVDTKNIIIDAKSGVSGAGRSTNLDISFCECTENMKAYKIATHRHTSEIEQELSEAAGTDVMVSFTPHLIPLKRGILSTCYANLLGEHTYEEILALYREFYKGEHFIRIMDGILPETNHVAGSNFVDIGFRIDERLNRIVVVSAIDNLIKGAAGQAVQNLNIRFGLPETTGLSNAGYYL
ncbi:MAG: N-acetyl-gamma-glutamyl-phosphate reductase [Ruminococcaceae bacterium]|nr:N-acetyl-gamma-glutamyl-phosphate reductase [Oscillospiraceae bacterium]